MYARHAPLELNLALHAHDVILPLSVDGEYADADARAASDDAAHSDHAG